MSALFVVSEKTQLLKKLLFSLETSDSNELKFAKKALIQFDVQNKRRVRDGLNYRNPIFQPTDFGFDSVEEIEQYVKENDKADDAAKIDWGKDGAELETESPDEPESLEVPGSPIETKETEEVLREFEGQFLFFGIDLKIINTEINEIYPPP